jgi:hypothetical protein
MVALAATMAFLGQPITPTGAAVFEMCVGIAVDDTIHSIGAATRRFNAGQSVRDSVINAYRKLGDAGLSFIDVRLINPQARRKNKGAEITTSRQGHIVANSKRMHRPLETCSTASPHASQNLEAN